MADEKIEKIENEDESEKKAKKTFRERLHRGVDRVCDIPGNLKGGIQNGGKKLGVAVLAAAGATFAAGLSLGKRGYFTVDGAPTEELQEGEPETPDVDSIDVESVKE